MLHHGRDVHPTWALVDNVTATVVTHYLVSPRNTRNWSEDGVLGQLEYSPLIERME